jgi:hypothetical protein
MNKELKLLAENMSVWPDEFIVGAWSSHGKSGKFIGWRNFPWHSNVAFTRNEWEAARIELGLDSSFTSPEEDEAWADAERRMDTIGQNGNTAEHYDAPPLKLHSEKEKMQKIISDLKAAEHYKEPPAIKYTRTAEQFLSQAADLLIERGKQYDKPGGERSMGSTVKAFNAITNKTLSESEGWLFMSILKRVRQFQGPYHKDSAEDAVSYSALEAEALERGL